MKGIVFLLGYKSLAGKDTFADAIKSLNFTRVAFADKLKYTVADLYNMTNEQVFGKLKDVPDERYPNLIDNNPEFQHLTPRRILQIFGQNQRAIQPDIWPRYAFDTTIADEMNKGKSRFIITDFRFINEYEVAKKYCDLYNLRLITIRIDRNISAKSGSFDVSENELNTFNKWNYIVTNNSCLQDYQLKCWELSQVILTSHR